MKKPFIPDILSPNTTSLAAEDDVFIILEKYLLCDF
jgi:hypothetical protein